ncbi:hypothetical protein L1A45_01270 [Acinetobacter variabilis]|uniref:hypothetical protein n=1 Tax=Acinetobacter variabilis TaxID=70346 RepID=UPI00376FC1FA
MIIPTLNVVDQAISEVQDKMKYFEGRSNQLLGEMSNAMTTLAGVTVDAVDSVPDLPRPENAEFLNIETPDAPELNVTAPVPHILDLDIERPTAMTAPAIPNLEINLPDAPIMQNDIEIPSELTNFTLPEIDTNIEIGTLPSLTLSGLDVHRDSRSVDVSELLGGLDLSDLNLPEAPENPILNFPTLPGLNDFALPVRPDIDIGAVELPNAPEIVLPEIGELQAITLPVYEPEALPVFDDLPPEFSVELPSDIDSIMQQAQEIAASDYHAHNKDNAIQSLVDEIRAWMKGAGSGSGLPAEIETSLFNRARERNSRETERAVQEVIDQWASRGYSLPQGTTQKQIDAIRDDARLKSADLNRDIMIQSFEKQLEQIRYFTEQGIALERLKQDLWLAYVGNVMDAAKFQVESKISLFNAQISIFNARNDAFKSMIDVYKTKIEGTIAKITAFRSQVEAQVAIGQINQQTVEIFKAKIDAVMSNVDVYKALIQGATARADLVKSHFDAYKTEVQAYSEQVGAERIKVDLFDSQIKAEGTKVQAYESLARTYASTIEGLSSKANIKLKEGDMKLEAARVRISEFQANTESYRASMEAQAKKLQFETEAYTANLEAMKSQIQLSIEKMNAQGNIVESNSRTRIALADALSKYAEMKIRIGIANSDTLSRFADMRSRTAIAVSEAHSRYADLSLRTTIANSDIYNRYIESRTRVALANADTQAKYADLNLRTNLAYADTQARFADMKMRTGIANAETQARYADMNIRTNLAYAEMQIKKYEVDLSHSVKKAELAAESMKGIAQFNTQLAAGAMSAMHVSASISGSGSTSIGYSASESESKSESHNYSY